MARGSGRRSSSQRSLTTDQAEAIGNEHHFAWAQGKPTPVAPTFERLATLWEATPDGATLTVEWPSLEIVDA